MAVTSSNDDGFREIQLSGKQLVFLFMAVTVVLVVTFLTGVLVGRGVRAERTDAAHADASTDAPPTPSRAPSSAGDAGVDPRDVAPPPQPEDENPAANAKNAKAGEDEPPVAVKRGAPADTSATAAPPKTTESPTKSAPAPAAAPAPVKAAPPPAPVKTTPPPAAPATASAASAATPTASGAPAAAATSEALRSGYAVQVVAVNVRGDADAIVKRLSGKGYSAYVEVPKGSTSVFRVRVGTFKTRREAQTVADRLKKEEKFKPWVTR